MFSFFHIDFIQTEVERASFARGLRSLYLLGSHGRHGDGGLDGAREVQAGGGGEQRQEPGGHQQDGQDEHGGQAPLPRHRGQGDTEV